MTICCLGDLVLDVIVRLEQPLAPNADATSRIVLRPGGQAANVAAWVSELGGSARFVGKRGADDAGLLAAARLRRARRGARRADRDGGQRGDRRARRPFRRTDDVLRPRRRDRASRPTRSTIRGSTDAPTFTSRATRSFVSPSVARPARPSASPATRGCASASTSRRGARSATSERRSSAVSSRSSPRMSSSQTGRGSNRRRAYRGRRLDRQGRFGRCVVQR